jgi:PAS domain S-box-containing protein
MKTENNLTEEKREINLNGVDIEWNLKKGNLYFFGISSTLFWNDPSLLNMFKPLVEEMGKEMYSLQVAYSSSHGTEEDYHAIVAKFGDTFQEGFLNWGKVTASAGWGVFELPYFDKESGKAKVVVRNPWELQVQSRLKDEERWGCPFIQGKVIGIFNHAFKSTCWADERYFYDGEESWVEFDLYLHKDSIADRIDALRREREQEKIRNLEVSKERFKKAVECTSDLIYEWNIERDSLKWFGDIDSFLGYEKGEISDNLDHLLNLIHPEDRGKISKKLAQHRENREVVESKYRVKAKDGKYRVWEDKALPFLDRDGKAFRWVGVCDDVTEKEETLEALQKSEERYRTLHESMLEAYVQTDMSGKIIDFNRAFLDLTGYSSDEVLNLTYIDLTPDKWREIDKKIINEQILVNGQSELYEKEYIRKDGKVISVELRAYLLRDSRGEPETVWASIRDISERKEREKRLIESEARFKSIFENSSIGIVVAKISDKSIGMVNGAMCELLDYSKEEFLKLTVSDIHPPKDLPAIIKQFEEQARGDYSLVQNSPLLKSDGTEILADISTVQIDINGEEFNVGMFQDVTKRYETEQNLKNSEARFKSIFDNASIGILVAKLSDKSLQMANSAICDMLGYSEEELLKRNITDMHSPEDLPEVIRKFEAQIRGDYSLAENIPMLKADGTKLIADVSGVTMEVNGESYNVGMFQDVTEKRETERKLKIFQEQIDHSLDSIVLLDTKTGGFLDYNRAFPKLLRTDREGLENKHIYDFSQNISTFEQWREVVEVLKEQKHMVVEDSGVGDDGNPYIIEVNATYINDEYIISILRDIDDKKRVEKEREDSLRRFETVLHTTQDGFWIADLSGKILEVNDSICEMEGYSREELLDMYVYEVDAIHSKETAQENLDVLRNRGSVFFQTVHRRKNGETHPVEVSSSYLDVDGGKLFAFMRDITEKKRYETELQELVKERTGEIEELKDQYETLVEDLGKRFVVYRYSFEGKLIYISRNVQNIFGLSMEESYSDNWQTVVQWTGDSIALGEEHGRKLRQKEEDFAEYELSFIHPTLGERFIRVSEHSNRDKNGDVKFIDGVIEDITEAKILQIELVNAKDIAEESTKAKSSFLANMSHEIRTPLNAIMGFIDLLKEREEDSEKLQYFNTIESSGKHLLQVINDILDISKIESGKLQIDKSSFNAEKEFNSIKDLYLAKCEEKNLTLYSNFQNLPPVLDGDVLRIKQVIFNLLSNAVKFTPNGKNIYLKIGYKNNLLSVSIRDEGIGINRDKQKRIFEAFNQEDSSTTRKYGGTGLGLTISYELVKLMGGELQLESEEERGSDFFFSIPLLKSDKKVVEKEEIEILPLNGHILLVEDNRENQLLMEVILRELNLEFDIAENGLVAVDMFKKREYDLILMDENMPIMNGIEATKKILEIIEREELKKSPIIALTANALKGDRERFLDAGMEEYLTKPIEIRKLYKVLSKYLKRSDLQKKSEVKKDSLPDFTTLDKEYGLKLVMGMESAYLQSLKGLLNYKNIDFQQLEDEQFHRVFHSLKGLTASAGALDLSEMAKEIEKSLDREAVFSFREKLNRVISEIEEKLEVGTREEREITEENRDRLFLELKEAVKTKRAKNCKPLIEELGQYRLWEDDKKLFEKVKSLIDKFKFREALELL